jgi:hypothetical protein
MGSSIHGSETTLSPRSPSFPPSPTTSSGFNNYNSLTGRSVRSSTTSEPRKSRTSLADVDGFIEREPYHNKEQEEKEKREEEQRLKYEQHLVEQERAKELQRIEEEQYDEEQRRQEEHRIQEQEQKRINEERHATAKKLTDNELEQKAEAIREKMTKHASLMNANELMPDYNWKVNGNTAALERKLVGELHSLEAVSTIYQEKIQKTHCYIIV